MEWYLWYNIILYIPIFLTEISFSENSLIQYFQWITSLCLAVLRFIIEMLQNSFVAVIFVVLDAFTLNKWVITWSFSLIFDWLTIICSQLNVRYINPVLTRLLNINTAFFSDLKLKLQNFFTFCCSGIGSWSKITINYSIYDLKRPVVILKGENITIIWKPPNLSDLTPIIFNIELTHFCSDFFN